MVRIGLMPQWIFHVRRREFLAGLGAVALVPARLRTAAAEVTQPWLLEAKAATIALQPGPATPVWSLQSPNQALRFRRGSQPEVILKNQLPVPVMLDWRGLDGAPAAEPLTSLPPLAPGATASFTVPLRRAGTFFCGLHPLGDGAELPARPLAFVVQDNEPVGVDRDEVFLVEDWRLRADGTAIAPGIDPKDAVAILTVNGQINPDIVVRSNERLRLRLINGCQHQVIAVKIEDYDVNVMALDGAPAEPFLARNGALVLAPGGRADAFIDSSAPPGSAAQILLHDGSAAHPIARLVTSTEPPVRPARLPPAPALPSDGLPAQLDLKRALRVDLVLAGPEWADPANFATSAAPAFQAKAGRTVVLALTNHADRATVFHLQGHHFRLLDRLDDGWKPFWLDTLAVEPGQTQRIAFGAENPGRWLLESVGTDWTAQRLVRWYGVG
jgi:FtsP/CotA-like multicopper oxidase with cupredoxin domain